MERKPLLKRSGGYLMGCLEDTGGSRLPEGVIDPWVLQRLANLEWMELKGSEIGIKITRWWFQIFWIFTPTWGRFPIWPIWFKGVETTNQIMLQIYPTNLGILGKIEDSDEHTAAGLQIKEVSFGCFPHLHWGPYHSVKSGGECS